MTFFDGYGTSIHGYDNSYFVDDDVFSDKNLDNLFTTHHLVDTAMNLRVS
jgi:hypothetical protein